MSATQASCSKSIDTPDHCFYFSHDDHDVCLPSPAFCSVLGTSLTDKCRIDNNLTEGVPGTRTVQSLISLFDPLDSIFEMAGYWKRSSNQTELHSSRAPRAITLSLLPSLCRLRALLSFSLNWFDTKIHHFLASWSLEQFLLLMQWDLPIFLDSFKKTFFLVQTLCIVQDDSGSWNSISVHYDHLQEQRNNLEVGWNISLLVVNKNGLF